MRMELAFATRGPEYPPPDLRYPDQNACRVISIKPVDIVVVDPSRMVVMVIDSQNSAMRAEVKKGSLTKVQFANHVGTTDEWTIQDHGNYTNQLLNIEVISTNIITSFHKISSATF
jgi:hypothetical protein